MQVSLLLLSVLAASASAFISNSLVSSRKPFVCNRVGPLFAESIKEIEGDAKERMGKSVDSVRLNLNTIRTGRANSAILDRVKVKCVSAHPRFS
jgi:ribosome recycling factor